MTDIVFPVFDTLTQLDMTGPAQVLSRIPGARIWIAAGSIAPVMSDCGFALMPNTTFDDCPQAAILCVPGGHGVAKALDDAALIGFIAQQAAAARFVSSVCTGAFLLGRAGLLEGRRATTHWAYAGLLPLVGAVHASGRVVTDGNVITGGGVTAGIDFGLVMAAAIAGEDVARAIQLAIEYDPAPPFACGSPASATADALARVTPLYDRAAERMRAALERGGT